MITKQTVTKLNIRPWGMLASGLFLATLLFITHSSSVIKAQEPTFEPPALNPTTTPLWYNDDLLPNEFDWQNYGIVTEARQGPRALPSDPNLTDPFVTAAKNQANCGSCYAFGALGSVEALLGRKGVGALDLSENNAKNCNASKQTTPGTCGEGGSFPMVVNFLNQKGTVLESADPYLATSSPTTCKTDVTYKQTILSWVKIGTWEQLPAQNVLKNYLVNYGPIEISIKADNQGETGQRFMNYDGITPIYMPLPLSDGTDHSVLLVGWNDNTAHEGGKGVWIIKNSWGTSWGKNGRAEVAYGSANLGMGYSFIPTDFQPYNTTGSVISYDKFGTGGEFYTSGLGSNGMVKFTPPQDSCVDRVELQLFGQTSNINTTIYDELGTKPLVSVKDISWPAGGNVSIPIPGTVRLKANDDVFVAVNLSQGNLSADGSTTGTGRSYLSYDNGQSWDAVNYTLNIRLRTKSCAVSAPVDPTATPTRFVPTATKTPLPTLTATATPRPATATATRQLPTATATKQPPTATATTPPNQPTATAKPPTATATREPTATTEPTATATTPANPVASICYDLTPTAQKRDTNKVSQPLSVGARPWKFDRFLPRKDKLQEIHRQEARTRSQFMAPRVARQSTPAPYFTGKSEEEQTPNVSGRIILPSGTPAAGADVTIYLLDSNGLPYDDAEVNVATDDAGYFYVYLENGDYSLDAIPTYIDAEQGGVTRLIDYKFSVNDTTTLPSIALPQAMKHIQGKVQDINGNPVSEVYIDVFNEDTQEWLWYRPQTDGTFDFAVGGGTWELTIYPDENSSWVLTSGAAQVSFAEDDSAETQSDVIFELQAAQAMLTGQIVDSNGQPFAITADSMVVGVWNNAGSYIYRFVQSDGKFSLPVLNGNYQPEIWLEYEDDYPEFTMPSLDYVEVNGNTDLGPIKLIANDSLIIGRVTSVNNEPIEGIYIDALQIDGSKRSSYTDIDGYYTMTIPAGDWQVSPTVADYEDYLYMGGGTEVTANTIQPVTANFSLEPIAGYLYGSVVDEQNQRADEISAYAYLRRANETEPLLTAPVVNGEFFMKMPFGDLKVGLYLDGNSGYTFINEVTPLANRADMSVTALVQHELAANEQPISAAQANEDKDITIQVKTNNAHIQGKLVDKNGATLQNSFGVIMAEFEGNSQVWQWGYLNDDGTYDLSVTAGIWHVSYEIYEDGYANSPSASTIVSVTSGQTVQQELALIKLDNTVKGQVVNEAGTPEPNIPVWVRSGDYETFVTTDEQGEFIAYLPSETGQATVQVGTAVATCEANASATACQIDAATQETTPAGRLHPTQTDVNLILRNGDAYLVGQVLNSYLNNSPVEGAAISGYNAVGGQSVQMTSDANGCFSTPIDKTTSYEWQLEAAYQFENEGWVYAMTSSYSLSGNSYSSRMARGDVPPGLSTNSALVLQNSGILPKGEFATFKVSQGWQYTLSDGTTIQIPANAINTREQQVQVYVNPVVNLPHTYLYDAVNYGYAISLYESNTGRQITNNLSKNIVITFRYDDTVNSANLVTGYLVNNAWHANRSSTHDMVAKEITMQTNKIGTFALLTPNQTTPSSNGNNTYLPIIVK